MNPVATAGLLLEEVDDELVVYDDSHHLAHRLSRTAALVFRHCDGQRDVAALADLLRDGVPSADEVLVRFALELLAGAGLVDGVDVRSAADVRLARRGLVRKLGVVGAGSTVLPAVTTIVAPAAAAATSCDECGCIVICEG